MTAQANTELLQRFYAAFGRRDGAAMAACYAPDATFSDPVFIDLSGEQPGAMWRMLTAGSSDLTVELVDAHADENTGSARWVARYTFTSTGKHVTNDVRSSFVIRGGRIVGQRDVFDFPRWARQALGLKGLLLGRTGFLKEAVRRQARARLDKFMASSGSEG